jgi:hypothetical protein
MRKTGQPIAQARERPRHRRGRFPCKAPTGTHSSTGYRNLTAGLCRRGDRLANLACYRWFYTLTSGGLWRARANAPAVFARFRGYHTVLNRRGDPRARQYGVGPTPATSSALSNATRGTE